MFSARSGSLSYFDNRRKGKFWHLAIGSAASRNGLR